MSTGTSGARHRHGDLPWQCRALGHDHRFHAEGRMLTWECSRDCGTGGSKAYATAEEAARYADALNPRNDLGRRAPLIGLFPLRLWRRLKHGDQ